MTIYIDVIFLENMILNFIILYATGIISKSKVKIWRILVRRDNRSTLCNCILLYEITAKYFKLNI